MHDRADRHGRQRHGVAWLNVGILRGDDCIARAQPLRSQNVAELTVLILDERDERSPVRIVLESLDYSRNIKLASLEINQAIRLLMSAADVARRDPALSVTSTCLAL